MDGICVDQPIAGEIGWIVVQVTVVAVTINIAGEVNSTPPFTANVAWWSESKDLEGSNLVRSAPRRSNLETSGNRIACDNL